MAKAARPEPTPGLVLVDKPQGWTSHDVVGKMRSLAQTKKVGHAGTLDPMATGLLILGVGKATKLLTYVVGHDKTYTATVRLGQRTVTDDAEGDVVETTDASAVTDQQIARAVTHLTGDIQQAPSAVSAIKVDGQRAYKRVRDGEDVTLSARPVTVHRFDVQDIRHDGSVVDVDIEVEVSSGTYVRALARDLGEALGVGGHLTGLRRTAVGEWGIGQAASIGDLEAMRDEGAALPLVDLSSAARAVLPAIEVSAQDATALGFGQFIDHANHPDWLSDAPVAAAIAPHGEVVALVERKRGRVGPVLVFVPADPATGRQ
ncbi:MAG: tRNA pseudouridine(55) synthase TruB [Demequina sp.]